MEQPFAERVVSGPRFWVFEDLIEIKISGVETGGAYCLIEDWPAPSFAPQLHRHLREEEVVHILEGEFVLVMDGGQQPLAPGDTVRIPAGVDHAFRNLGTGRGHRLVLFSPAGPDALWTEVGHPATAEQTEPPAPIEVDLRAFFAAAQRHGLEVRRLSS